MADTATNNVFVLLKALGMTGLRLCEGDPDVTATLVAKGYQKTPDLICGPVNLNEAPLEGLFAIDVNQPTGDFLFKEKVSEKLGKSISQHFRDLLGNGDKFEWGLNQLPTEHHGDYLKVLNNKLDKYSHQRSKTCNTGIVHYFDLGESTKDSFANQDSFFTMLDYLHFYAKLDCKSGVKDLIEGEQCFLKELTADEPENPYIVLVRTDWDAVPALFLMLHAITNRKDVRYDFGLIMLNTEVIGHNRGEHPIHKWFIQLAESGCAFSTDTKLNKPTKIVIQKDKLPFR